MQTQAFDWQGHRGCRGLLPENSIPAFLHVLDMPKVTTLELDVLVTKDGQLIISHDPWMSSNICSHPDGSPVTKLESPNLRIYGLTYEEIKAYDCGNRGNSHFPQQQAMKTYKPLFSETMEAVKAYCQEKGRPLPNFNVEIKSSLKGDGTLTPPIEEFTQLVLDELNETGVKEHCNVQSFDPRPLQLLRKLDPSIPLALLVENMDGIDKNLERLGFKPEIYSCHYRLLRKKEVKKLHEQGIKVIPWTVNSVKPMKKLRRWGVDGIITDYPNLIAEVEGEK